MDPELYNAAINGSYKSFSKKIRLGVNWNLQLTSQGNSLLHVAAKSRNKKIAEVILNNSQRDLMYEKNSEGNTALHIAASLGHFEMTQLLIDRAKPQLRMVNLDEDTHVHVAVRNGHYKIVEILIREEPRWVLSTNSAGESPLFVAVDRGFYKIAHHIIKKVPECSYEGRNDMNVVHAAAIRTHNYFVREVLNNRPSALLEKDDFGWIPLQHAAHAGNAKVVELFLENNHHLACIIDKEGMSALHISAKKGHVQVMRTLITKCPEICELLDSRGRTALHVAVENGKSGAVKVLLETVAFHDLINKKDKEGNTPLHLAAFEGSFSVLARLAWNRKVEKGATNKKGMTAIDIFSSNIDEDLVIDIFDILYMMFFRASLEKGLTREDAEANRQSQENETKDEAVKDMAKTTQEENAKEKEYERMKDTANTNLLIATIIATVTFAAGVALPGGFNTSIDSLPTLTRNSTSPLRRFVVSNSLAFGFSSASMFLHFMLSLLSLFTGVFGASYPKYFVLFLTECALLSMVFAFNEGTGVVFPDKGGFDTTFISFSPVLLLSAYLFLSKFKKK